MPKKDKYKKYKRKKEKKSKKKRKKRTSDSDDTSSAETESSSTSSSSSEDEWIEMKKPNSTSVSRDDWMSETSFVPTFSLKDVRKKQAEDKKQKEEQRSQEENTRVGKELNPYWKDGGSGLPEKYHNDGKPKLVSQTVGDQGVDWLKKALKRAEQTAREENRSLESVAAERYGSLKNLYQMIDDAENRNRRSKHDWRNRPSSRRRSRDRSSERYSSRSGSGFQKPTDDDRVEDYASHSRHSSSSQPRQGWRKRKTDEDPVANRDEPVVEKEQRIDTPSVTSSASAENTPILTDAELNSLAAKIVKAEIMGNEKLVAELKEKLENARKARDTARLQQSCPVENVMILTETNARGVTQPVRGKVVDRRDEKKKKKYETHVDGERVRYFEDDGKYSLTEMFEKEQMTSAADVNAEFVRLSSKSKGDKDHAVDDLFMEQSTSNKSKKDHDRSIATEKQRNRERTLDKCSWCLTNNKLQKHLIISTSSKAYLSLPYFQSLTEYHCLIAPIYHATCSTLLDEDIWEEIMEYCQKLVRIFREHDLDAVFFETAMNFKYYPHMTIHCVPIPYQNSNFAPIYFKKAIMECEKEWAQNKKVVDINKMNVRRAIPKGLPYFMVNFGMDNGFAHVIEDEQYFPKNFAQEIIGGMLDLDHSVWRKSRPDNFEAQCKKVNKFKKIWDS